MGGEHTFVFLHRSKLNGKPTQTSLQLGAVTKEIEHISPRRLQMCRFTFLFRDLQHT